MVGSKIYENDSYLRAVVGSYRETGTIQFKKFFLFFLFHQKTLLVNYFQKPWQYLKSSREAPFLRKIGKFKIGLNLGIMQIEAFSKRSYEKPKGSLYFIFTRCDKVFSKLLSSYVLSRFKIFFYFLHPFKESKVSSFVDTVNFTIFQKVVVSRVHLYIFSGCENCLLKKPCILPVCHTKSFFLSRQNRAR